VHPYRRATRDNWAESNEPPAGAIYAVYDGLVLLSTATAESLAIYGDQSPEVEGELSEEITSRETEVLRMLAEGLVNKEIASHLRLDRNTKLPS
jgi:DNA-binding NarL/FixJ family response regulator